MTISDKKKVASLILVAVLIYVIVIVSQAEFVVNTPDWGSLSSVAIVMGAVILSIPVHELGHYMFLKDYTSRKIKFTFKRGNILCGCDEDYQTLTDNQYLIVNLAGVVLGMLPLVVVSFIKGLTLWIVIGGWVLYFIASKQDIQQIVKVIRNENRNRKIKSKSVRA